MKLTVLVGLLGILAGQARAADRLSYYCATYDACRTHFRTAVAKVPGGETGSWKVPSAKDQDLTIDYLYLAPTGTPKDLLVLTSGVHGVEGYASSAVQRLFLTETLPTLDRRNLGVLVIHGINPYGMKYHRRVSENNVDLNRNFDVDSKLFSTPNDGYRRLEKLLNPEGPVSSGFLSRTGFYYQVGRALMKDSLKTLRQAVLGGQYAYPRGLYYGGKDFEPQRGLLEGFLVEKAAAYPKVLVLDLHTGYGKNGFMHLFANPYETPAIEKQTRAVFAGYPIDEANSKEFYATEGDFSLYVARLMLQRKKLVVPMVLEFGTFDNSTSYYRSIESIRRMIAENRMHWYGAKDAKTRATVHSQFMELYFPKERRWRKAVMDTPANWLPIFIRQFQSLPEY